MKKRKITIKKIICLVICVILICVTGVADFVLTRSNMAHTITAYLTGGMSVKDKKAKTASYENAAKIAKTISDEGIVLLKNENNSLPLKNVSKINLFGYASAHTFVSGSGSGSTDTGKAASLKKGFESVGINVNDTLYNKYLKYGDGKIPSDFKVIEPDITDKDFYSDDLWKSYQDYSNIAVMVIGRKSGEGADLIHGYLSLSDNEKKLLEQLKGKFNQVYVLINAGNPMELGFLDDSHISGALLMHYTGNSGAYAVAEIMTGKVNPSGKTVDCYAYDHSTSPSYYTSGVEATRAYTGINKDAETGKGYYYVDYNEGIYVGYRYYETRYVDNKTGKVDEEGYSKSVQYPFGYGLSYTSFKQEIVSHKGSLTSNGSDEISVTVKVTNTGNVAGKDIVQLYDTPPYYVGGIEKSAVNLVAYGKTKEIKPGESQELTLTFKVQDLTSYDYNDANKNGHKGYELDNGDYSISLRSDSHSVIDSFKLNMASTASFDTDSKTGAKVKNLFDDAAGQNETETVKYLSRADWQGTWYKGDGKATTIDYSKKEGMTAYTINYADGRKASQSVLNSINEYVSKHYADNDKTATMPTTGEKNNLTISDMKGLKYDDPTWDKLLNQMTVEELKTLIGSGGMEVGAVKSIGLALLASNDGQAGITAAYAYNGAKVSDPCYAYPNEVCIASTWNKELAHEFGLAVGQEANATNVSIWYAPGANTHRTPYGGRDCEYFSEDPLISGTMSAKIIQGCYDNKLVAMVKHFALNEQETARNVDGLYTWANEQSIREIYLRPFEIAVKTSDNRAIMTSFNRIGATWTGSSSALLTDLLRNEWGYRGVCESDAYVPMKGGDSTYYMNMNAGIRAGNDLWLQGIGTQGPSVDTNKAYTVSLMRERAHNILYAVSNTNHLKADTSLPLWEILLIVGSVVIYAACLFSLHRCFLHKRKEKVENLQ